jgi:hypothetical protein
MKKTMNTQPTRLRGGARILSLFSRVPEALLAAVIALTLLWPSAAHAGRVLHDVAAVQLQVDQIDYPTLNPDTGQYEFPPGYDDNTNSLVSVLLSINNMQLGTYNRADINVQVGASMAADVINGVLLSSVMENGRENHYGTNRTFYPISTVHDGWRICSFVSVLPVAGNGAEYNVNVAGAWFPYSKYIGALVRNSTRANGGTNDTLIGHPSLVLGTHFYWWANGRFIVDLTSLGIDSRTDGVLLANHGKDENNFGLTQVNDTNGTWTVYSKDMSTPTFSSFEQDPVAFVYIPKTNTLLISGMFNGNGSIAMHSGDTPQFTVRPKTEIGAGRWELKIPGHSPSSGVLIISACAGGSLNTDNIVSYEPDGDGWEIQSRDTPGMGLQTVQGSLGEPEPVCTFVFIPAPTPGITVTPTANLMTSEDGSMAQFTVELDAKPTADVTIGVSSSDTSEGTVDVSSLTFTPENWNIPQLVTLIGQDDALADGQIAYTIILAAATSTDTNYSGMKPTDVAVLNADNEAGITVNKNLLVTTEAGGSDTFTVVLNTQPTADVTIGISSSDTSEGTVFPASLIFTAGDWSTPQNVTVIGVNDVVEDGDVLYSIVTAPAVSADPAYSGVNAFDVPAINLDNDKAGINVTPTQLTVSESGTSANFTVVLGTQPTADVTVTYVSGDTSEGTVSPASRTFTTANWGTPQTFTVTGVDDAINDGDITYNLQGSVTSSDAVYAATVPAPILVTTLDNEAVLTLPSGPAIYGIGTVGIGLDGWATLQDSVANYNGGTLTVTLTGNGTADDRLTIRNTGTDVGQIGVAGSNVSYGGTTIGAFAGGEGLTPLVVTFNSAATPEAAQALIRAVMFSNVSSEPVLANRTATVALARAGGVSSAEKTIQVSLLRITHFQEGADHGHGVYTGTGDINLWATFPEEYYPEGSHADGMAIGFVSANVDRTVLLRFDDIMGDGPGQIPTNAIIVHAELQLFVINNGDGSRFHRMLIPWHADLETYSTIGDGVQLDDFEARSAWDSAMGVPNLSGSTGTGRKAVAVTPDVQAWANGEANYGWFMSAWDVIEGYDFWAFSPSEHTNITWRPSLLVKWVPEGTPLASFRYGVNDYTNTFDARLRGGANADVEGSALTALFPDYEITTEMLDQDHGLMRFEDIIGAGDSQVPVGATVHAAMLDFSAQVSNAPGNGFRLHPMLQAWDHMDTFNMWGEGIQADGVEAAVTPTALLTDFSGAAIPYVPGGYHSLEVTPDVQAWAYISRPNYGWAFLPFEFGRDGFGVGSAEQALEVDRPQLRVFYSPGTIPEPEDITLLSPVWSPTSVQVSFTAKANTTYSVQRVGVLGGTWQTLGQATTQGDGAGTYTDASPLPDAAFYRVVSP